jgi:hypothetical protein
MPGFRREPLTIDYADWLAPAAIRVPVPQGGAEKVLASRTHPEISLRETRDKRDEIRRDPCNGTDPAARRLETPVFLYVGQVNEPASLAQTFSRF